MAADLKEFKILLYQENGSSTFQPSLLSGVVELCPSKPLEITEVRIKLVGKAFVALGGTERREEFLELTQTIYPSDEERVNLGEITTLQEKVRYSLPFAFLLMDHLPSSFAINSSYSGIAAHVQYFAESSIMRRRSALACKHLKEFKFLQTRDLSAIPEYTTPKLFRKTHRVGLFNSAFVHLECKLDRTAYYVGETIVFDITVDNSGRRQKTKFVMAQLVQDIDLIEKENDHLNLHKTSTIKVLQSIVVVDAIEAKKRERLSKVKLSVQLDELPPSVETRKSVRLHYAIVIKVAIDEKSKFSLRIPVLVAQKPLHVL